MTALMCTSKTGNRFSSGLTVDIFARDTRDDTREYSLQHPAYVDLPARNNKYLALANGLCYCIRIN
jgi:hypothetical protein